MGSRPSLLVGSFPGGDWGVVLVGSFPGWESS